MVLRGFLSVSGSNGRGAHWVLSAIVAAFLIALYSVVLAAVRPQVVLAAPGVEVSFTTPATRTYDGTTRADILTCTVETDVSPDEVFCEPAGGDAVADFDDRNAGQDKAVTASPSDFVLTGANSGDYEIISVVPTTGTIDQAPLTISAVTDTKTYDGTTDSTAEPSVVGLQDDDSVTGAVQAYDSRNAGSRTLSVTAYTVNDGNDGNNYDVDASATAAGTIDQAPLTVTAVPNVKTADGTTSAAATPSVTGTIYTPDTADFIETYDTAAADSGKQLTPSGVVNDGNDGDNYDYTFVPKDTGQIRPAPAASVEFVTQPIDTKTNTPIYSVCVPSGGTAPCALAGSTATDSTPIQVRARDAFGNLAGPGSPGADGTTAAVNIQIRRDSASGASLGNASTSNGVARFDDQLIIGATGPNKKLHASATSGSVPTPAPALSNNFAIVTDLFACTGTRCNNNGNNAGGNQLQKAGSQIRTANDFFVAGATNVLLSTRFTSGSDTNQTACGFKPATGSTPAMNATIGQATDIQVTGTGVAGTAPSTAMVMIMPKGTLKFFGITSRGATSFNLCLGALKIDPGSPVNVWKGKDPNAKKLTLVNSQGGSEGRQWGVPADCGTSGLSAADPCIGLRTKQVSVVRSYLASLGWTTAQINALGMSDADFAIVLRKGSPWDGKGGLY